MPWMTMLSAAIDAERRRGAVDSDSDAESDADADANNSNSSNNRNRNSNSNAAPRSRSAMPLIMSSIVKKSTPYEHRLQEVEKWFLDPVSSHKILMVVEPRDPNLKVDLGKAKFFASKSTRLEDLEAELAVRLGIPAAGFELIAEAGGHQEKTAAAYCPSSSSSTPFKLYVQEPIPEDWDHTLANDLGEEHSIVRTPNKYDTINELANRFLHTDGWLYLAFEVNMPIESFSFSSPKFMRGIEAPLIEVSTYEKHCTQVARMRDKGRVPVILLPRGQLPYVPENRLALRGRMQLWELRHRLQESLTSEGAASRMECSEVLYLLVKDDKAVKMMDELEDLWEKYKDETDGWLYIYYAAEATLG
mmetsp:Transcript_31506/g.66930  ORF Transcript_31506/g.66930 Transcript_31506/m.66930 type:complete len:361 (-) Transcript_31506:266-1348(-)